MCVCVCVYDSPLQEMITHQLTFAELEKGINMVNKSSESIKVVLLPK